MREEVTSECVSVSHQLSVRQVGGAGECRAVCRETTCAWILVIHVCGDVSRWIKNELLCEEDFWRDFSSWNFVFCVVRQCFSTTVLQSH